MILGTNELTVDDLWAWLTTTSRVTLDPVAISALRVNQLVATQASASLAAYGRTTGVGANRDVDADNHDGDHGMRLIRSHAAGAGDDLGEEVARAMMLVRANQLARPGSGITPEIVLAHLDALNEWRTPVVRMHGAVGTGEITVLGELALCLAGELPWRDGTKKDFGVRFGANDALAYMSSSAVTIANAAIALRDVEQIAKASLVVAALTALPVRANSQQWSQVAAGARPSPGVAIAAEVMRSLVDDSHYASARTQDPFGWRAIPYIFGPLLDAIAVLRKELSTCINFPVENPRFIDGSVWHHGGFHLTSLALRLDHLRLALTQWVTTSLGRMVKLNDPAYTGQQRFLASGPAGSSGTMVLEYTAASALETLRLKADAVTRHTTVISIGTEDHASFATQSVFQTREAVDAARIVVSCELVTAVRAARHAVDATAGRGLTAVLAACAELPTDLADRVLVGDVRIAQALLGDLASLFDTRF
jgi:histidine ammonia-lyase